MSSVNREELQKTVDALNGQLGKLGMFPLAVVDPKDCIGQKKNARYFEADKFSQLVTNIKGDGALESAPLLFQDEKLKKEGKYEIISGHHRVDAAKAANLPLIIAFLRVDIDRQQLVSKQLSHNALAGKDDAQVLKELFESITDLDLKLASGLQDEIGKITIESLNFRVGTYKSFMIMFTPPDIDDFEAVVKEMMENTDMGGSETIVKLAAMDDNQKFIDTIQRIKKVENIKSNAVAIHRILELAKDGLKSLEAAKVISDQEKAEAKADEKGKKPKAKIIRLESLDEN